ncbi:hypothetical protein ABPG72_014503 [Tetrahymena utriculariae]
MNQKDITSNLQKCKNKLQNKFEDQKPKNDQYDQMLNKKNQNQQIDINFIKLMVAKFNSLTIQVQQQQQPSLSQHSINYQKLSNSLGGQIKIEDDMFKTQQNDFLVELQSITQQNSLITEQNSQILKIKQEKKERKAQKKLKTKFYNEIEVIEEDEEGKIQFESSLQQDLSIPSLIQKDYALNETELNQYSKILVNDFINTYQQQQYLKNNKNQVQNTSLINNTNQSKKNNNNKQITSKQHKILGIYKSQKGR